MLHDALNLREPQKIFRLVSKPFQLIKKDITSSQLHQAQEILGS